MRMSAVTHFFRHVDPTWIVVVFSRICFAVVFLQTGYVHPDEFFQNTEVVAGDLFGLKIHRTWEFTSPYPIRSMTTIWMTTLIPLSILKLIWSCVATAGTLPSPVLLLMVPRIFACAASFVCDYAIYHLAAPPAKQKRRFKALVFLGSSYVTCVFYTRTFSNSIESYLLALLLLCVNNVMHNDQLKLKDARVKVSRRYCLISFLLCIGTFNRPTFICFALPAIVFWLCSRVDRNIKTKKRRTRAQIAQKLAKRVAKLGMCFLLWAQYPIMFDTFYFHPETFSRDGPRRLVVAPLNFILYNLDTANLELHGRHPNFLHLLVNFPLLFNVLGIPALWASCKVLYDRLSRTSRPVCPETLTVSKTFDTVAACTLLLPLCALSLFKHQEPRFLVPLLIPVVLMAHRHFSTKLMEFCWGLLNILFIVFFGYVHQGGLIPCMLNVHGHLAQYKPNVSATVMFAHTYMPPRHLLTVKEGSAAVEIVDMMGTNLKGHDLMLYFMENRASLNYLVAPPSFVDSEMALWKDYLHILCTSYTHFSSEHLPHFSYADYLHGRVSLSDLTKALTLNVYLVQLPKW
ncbi:phosphatidylinositol glycan anchor biosynthesis class Z [Dermacentor variabilis]|uniref:phosphatidylinositol glycan anchor biosynthesis class Z n=1 Tax=Dermacentor variabilis TaxID=34621 RepID=UPI003F5AF441